MTTSEFRPPRYRALMRDTARSTFGEFMGLVGGKVHLRPVGGGCEWPASPDCVRLATYAEVRKHRGRAAVDVPEEVR